MKRFVVALMGLLILDAGVALAMPGPDPEDGHRTFRLKVSIENPDGPAHGVDTTAFDESAGWDFGDRSAYRCAWVEFFKAGNELFEVEYHVVSNYPETVRLNDEYGQESPDGQIAAQCWGSDDSGTFVHDGSDHFPHGTSLVFYEQASGTEIARIDYPNRCTNGYWTPGNDPGEAWLWWDEDGPEDMHAHGDGECAGGPLEPVAIARAKVRHLAPGIETCVIDATHGDMCSAGDEPAISIHASRMTFRLRGHLRASGFVRVRDGMTSCERDRVVVIQRRTTSGWKKAGRDRTSDTGWYREHMRNRPGVYRARVLEAALENGDICQADVSRKRTVPS
jgi:hypothetical protein